MTEDIEKILDRISFLRINRQSEQDSKEFDSLIEKLIDLKVYVITPAMINHHFSFKTMVENYGSRWFKYDGLLNCWNCGKDLRDLVNGPPFKLEIGQYDEVDDRTIDYICPFCGISLKPS